MDSSFFWVWVDYFSAFSCGRVTVISDFFFLAIYAVLTGLAGPCPSPPLRPFRWRFRQLENSLKPGQAVSLLPFLSSASPWTGPCGAFPLSLLFRRGGASERMTVRLNRFAEFLVFFFGSGRSMKIRKFADPLRRNVSFERTFLTSRCFFPVKPVPDFPFPPAAFYRLSDPSQFDCGYSHVFVSPGSKLHLMLP